MFPHGVRSRNGSVSVYMIIMLAVIVTVVSLVLDECKLFLAKYELQSAVDAAAVAGVSMFSAGYERDSNGLPILQQIDVAINPDLAKSEADKYFYENLQLKGLDDILVLDNSGECTTSRWKNPEYSYTVRVMVKLFFMPPQEITVRAKADVSIRDE